MSSAILGYGAYIPRPRMKYAEIEKAWPERESYTRSGRLGVREKAVGRPDEDVVTMAYEAARNALRRAGIEPSQLNVLLAGSMSRFYVDKSIATSVAQMLGVSDILTCDCVHSSRSGTSALLLGQGMVESGTGYALAVATDDTPTSPGSDLEPLAGAGAAAFVLGPGDGLAQIEASYSYSSEIFDMWRPNERPHPYLDTALHASLYAQTTAATARKLLGKVGAQVADFDYLVFHQPDGRGSLSMGRRLGATPEQQTAGLVAPQVGNLLSASVLVGLVAVLDQAQPDQRILIASYGAGCSDAISLRVTEGIKSGSDSYIPLAELLNEKEYIDYVTFLQYTRQIEAE